ncbi:MAG: TrmH family RNA methyltransferase [Chitinispirillaceae bacterium]|jgi:tRNA C32,U32 (ribose-2'-O)-methylase TrmJ
MAHQEESPFCLVSLDTQGEWNRPLLENAAAISGSECIFTSSDNNRTGLISGAKSFDEVLQDFRNVIACEIVRDSVDIFNFPAPRERTAVLVGHEQTGIPRSVLKKADSIVSIPMVGAGMSSVNVAVSAAITLYVLSKDIGRMKKVKSRLAHRDVDILINAPEDPHELGSLLRSIWAFGWRRVFLNDPHSVWFSSDKNTILDSRAAARKFKNPLVVLPIEKLDFTVYDQIFVCDETREGQRLSRFQIPDVRNFLVVYGKKCERLHLSEPTERLFVDYVDHNISPCFRHQGSTALSYISSLLKE